MTLKTFLAPSADPVDDQTGLSIMPDSLSPLQAPITISSFPAPYSVTSLEPGETTVSRLRNGDPPAPHQLLTKKDQSQQERFAAEHELTRPRPLSGGGSPGQRQTRQLLVATCNRESLLILAYSPGSFVVLAFPPIAQPAPHPLHCGGCFLLLESTTHGSCVDSADLNRLVQTLNVKLLTAFCALCTL